ncbi:MAG: hypothetical protein J6I76_18865 [Oribacterium sp.]|nr:hypothetical protein [Oribacterium sp.]
MIGKKENLKKYREIRTKEEARDFQKRYYGDYCSEYNINRKKMKSCSYEYRMIYAGKPIEVYLGEVYSQVNAYMRGIEQPQDDYRRYDLDMLIDRINEIIYCAPTLPEDIVVYRAIDEKTLNIIMQSVKEYNAYIEKGFMSTSLLKESLLEDNSSYTDLLKIYVPQGIHVLGVDFIKDRGEYEMLFPEKQHLKYIGHHKNIIKKARIYEFQLIKYAND